jgi:putative transposase
MGTVGEAPIVQLILDGTVVVDRDLSTSRDMLVLIGAPTDGQKVLLAVKAMGGESAPRPGARWSMISSGPAWGNPVPRRQSRVRSRARVGRVPVQRCTVHKQRNLLALRPSA